MHTEIQARDKVLKFVNSAKKNPTQDEFVIINIRLSKNKDYWVATVNSKAYVENGNSSKCYVGVSAYMLNSESGEVEVVGNSRSPETYLQDKYDINIAEGKEYILVCAHDTNDKKAIVNTHKVFNCSLQHAMYLTRENRNWFTGIKRHLEEAKTLLESKGIITEIKLLKPNVSIPKIANEIIWWEAMEKIISEKLNA